MIAGCIFLSVLTFGHVDRNLSKETGENKVKNSNVVVAKKTVNDLSACLKWTNDVRTGVQNVEYNQETGACSVIDNAWGLVKDNGVLLFMCIPK